MQKKKCEICGEMVPQCDMSKSYKHRCKKCVADMTRANRHAEKQKQEVHDNEPHTLDPATPYGKPVCTEVLMKRPNQQAISISNTVLYILIGAICSQKDLLNVSECLCREASLSSNGTKPTLRCPKC